MTNRPLLTMLVLAGVALGGCDARPEPVHLTLFHEMKVIGVAPGDQEEAAAATANETTRAEYLHRLQLLVDYYARVGNKDKLDWARREQKNAQEAQWFTWAGIPPVAAPTGGTGSDERWLVERVVQARNAYTRAVAQLRALYEQKGEHAKAECIRRVQGRLDEVRVYDYNFEADIPGPNLRPRRTVPEAETLFGAAYEAYRSGKALPLLTSYSKERQALGMFQDMIRKYPDSLRIAMAAFYVGEIYKEFFNENLRAVRWYERAWQWDPQINLPARFQAAVVYDQKLRDSRRAIELYREVLKVETFNQSNVNYAHRRLNELVAREAPAPAAPASPAIPTVPAVPARPVPVAPTTPVAPAKTAVTPPTAIPSWKTVPLHTQGTTPDAGPIILPDPTTPPPPASDPSIPLGAPGTGAGDPLAPVEGVGPARRD